jgi:ubiquinone/menaquinone biosynthesis C-methylase UbiE
MWPGGQNRINNMHLYEKFILPRLLDCACGLSVINEHRAEITQQASGLTLELGIGSGLNHQFYEQNKLISIVGIDPSDQLLRIAKIRSEKSNVSTQLYRAVGEKLPFQNNTFDSVVVTFAFCSIPNPLGALKEIKRVCKPTGQLLFCEHGLAKSSQVQKWQHRIEPIWKKVAGGCHLTRDIGALIKDAGFSVKKMENTYVRAAPKFVGFLYKGAASPNI